MMDELIERLEKATGPDRELDCAVWEVALPRTFQRGFWDARASLPRGEPDADAKARARMRPPAYTASLDAALTLVPEGAYNVSLEWDDEPADFIVHAGVMFAGEDFHGSIGKMGTPLRSDILARALCIAALRARGQQT